MDRLIVAVPQRKGAPGSSIGKRTKRLKSPEGKDDESWWLPPQKQPKDSQKSRFKSKSTRKQKSGPEQQRRYRERVKANPDNYEENLYRDREQWWARQEKNQEERTGYKKPAQEMARGCWWCWRHGNPTCCCMVMLEAWRPCLLQQMLFLVILVLGKCTCHTRIFFWMHSKPTPLAR